MKYYAIINEENICTGFASAPSKINADNYIEIPSLPAPMDKKYENGEWVEVEQEEAIPEPTQLDRIEEQVKAIANGTTAENTDAINALLGV